MHAHAHTHARARTHVRLGIEKGLNGGGKENRKRENRDGDERLINPPFGGALKTFDSTADPPNTPGPCEPVYFSARWFDVSFFLINSTFASITQGKHPSEGRGTGEDGEQEWGRTALRECGRQSTCSAFQAFVIPGNLFPVNILSQ